MVPSIGGCINGLTEFAYKVRGVSINKVKRLRHIDILKLCTMQKCIIDIKLKKHPTSACHKIKNEAYKGGLDNRTKGVVIVHVRVSIKTFCNKMSFMSINRAIR